MTTMTVSLKDRAVAVTQNCREREKQRILATLTGCASKAKRKLSRVLDSVVREALQQSSPQIHILSFTYPNKFVGRDDITSNGGIKQLEAFLREQGFTPEHNFEGPFQRGDYNRHFVEQFVVYVDMPSVSVE